MAHFESRNEVALEGVCETIEVMNNFIESLKKNNVANVRVGRSGEEMREIKSSKGKMTFDIEFKLIEEVPNKSAFIRETSTFAPDKSEG